MFIKDHGLPQTKDKRGERMSFLKDIIMLNAKDFFQTEMDIYVNIAVFIAAIALCLASFLINYHKSYTLLLIRQLIRRDATSEEKAITLSQMHLLDSKAIKSALSRRSQLSAMVKMQGYTAPTYEEYVKTQKAKKRKDRKNETDKIDFLTARFFIPEDQLNRAKIFQEKENPTLPRTILICVFIVAFSVCIALLMPEILRLLNNLIEKV